jgi:putative hydrolase of HD superfamily
MQSFMQEMLGGEGNKEARERIWSLWEVGNAWLSRVPIVGADPVCFGKEYEARETPESKLVKDLDRLELILQAIEYERCKWTNPASSRSGKDV